MHMTSTFYNLQHHPDETLLSETEVSLSVRIAEAVRDVGGRALVVGGYPRDIVMYERLGKRPETKDVDLEVYGLDVDTLKEIIEPIHHVNTVGASFGVLKVGPLDVSLPRKDSKTGRGHRGFIVEADPGMTHKAAAKRRDFTINTLALDPLTGELIDEYDGIRDIEAKLLRATDPKTFGDDPLRSLRAMQFAGRFEFDIDPDTTELARGFDLSELSADRIGEEWTKLLLKSERPSIGLTAGLELGIIHQLHPELAALTETPQEPEWHPEGNVWNHTLLAVDVAAKIVRREKLPRDTALTVMLGALTHDMGKASTTKRHAETGRIRSPEHAKEGVEAARSFMKTIHVPAHIRKKVERIIFDHMFLPEAARAKDAAIRRLAKRLYPATIQELIWVTEADFLGRTLENPDLSLIQLFQKRANELAVTESPMEPLVKGRDLMTLGEEPGVHMGEILKQLETAQIDGQFGTYDEAIAYYKEHIAS
jgi:tRNA nucleotidyltransferase (CCA-adding enzyme)